MKFNEGQIVSNFLLKKIQKINDINSQVYLFEHTKTKTEVLALKNSDTNKNFGIVFKTLPEDSTGVPHILEHCVLSGSEKYPLKDVFTEIYKGGLLTFLNAFTAADRTSYPFATRNEKEYFNTMDIYLNTTLFPTLSKEAFMQEAWRHHLTDIKEDIEYKGIVFNEMKGYYSDTGGRMYSKVWEVLMPESTYAVSSGGDPEYITDLTYEQFKAFHKKFYHPSNAKIYLYGDACLEKELEFIDTNYLSKFGYDKPKEELKLGKQINGPVFKAFPYPSTDETGKGKSQIAIVTKTAPYKNTEAVLALSVLSNILFKSDASPLKDAINKSNLGTDFGGYFNDKFYSTYMYSRLSGTDIDKKDEYYKLYFDTLRKIAKEGFDKELLEGELNSIEFSMKYATADVHRGMNYFDIVTPSLMYGDDVFEVLKMKKQFDIVRKRMLTNGYLEQIINKYLLDEKNTIVVTLYPDKEMNERQDKNEKAKLKEYKNSLTEKELLELIEQSKKMEELQQAKESEENLAKLPKLSLSDLGDVEKHNLPESEKVGDAELLISKEFTNSLFNIGLGVDLSVIPIDLLPYVNMFTSLLTEIGTKNRDYLRLSKELSSYVGAMGHSVNTHTDPNDVENYRPILWFEIKGLSRYKEKIVELISDIHQNLVFTDKKRIKEVIFRIFTQKEKNVNAEGYIIPMLKLRSYLNSQGNMMEKLNGYTAYTTLKNICNNYDELEDDFISKMEQIKDILFNKKNLIFHLTAENEDIDDFKKLITDLYNCFGDKDLPKYKIGIEEDKKNIGYITSADVVYDVFGGDLYGTGYKFSGAFDVYRSYLDKDHLFNQVRAIGGAYGVWSRFSDILGYLMFLSYRDPNVKATMDAFAKVGEIAENLEMTPDELERIKIGTYSNFDRLKNVFTKSITARDDYLTNTPHEYYSQTAKEILNTTIDDIKELSRYLNEFSKNSYRLAIGSEKKITDSKDLFDELVKV